MRSLRLSTTSASAPAGSANRNMGSDEATCTSETEKGAGSRLVISQPAAALCIHVPMLETTVAVQSTAKARSRNGAKDDASSDGGTMAPFAALALISAMIYGRCGVSLGNSGKKLSRFGIFTRGSDVASIASASLITLFIYSK